MAKGMDSLLKLHSATPPWLFLLLLAITILLAFYSLRLLRKNRLHLRRIESALSHKSTSLDAAIDELLKTQENLPSSQDKDSLHMNIADISHDLRTPLTAVQGYLETLLTLGDSLSAEDRKEYTEIALRNTQSVIQQIKDLLKVFKDPRKSEIISRDMISLEELFEGIYERFRPAATKKELQFESLAPKTKITILADRLLIERAISNFLANAIRYTPEGGHVRLSAQPEKGRVRICVEDTGIGIPEEDLPNICQRFYRVNKDRSRSTGGSGLGLAIASDILDKHNAELEILSAAGKGTKLTFYLDIVQ